MGAGRRAGRSCVAILALVVLLAACSGDDSSSGDPDGTPGPTTQAGADGGVLTLGLDGPVVVDPVAANPGSPSELMVLDLLHDGLTRMGPDGELSPALATSWRHDGQATAWAFVLDPDATFTDGQPVTPESVIASLEHLVKAGSANLAALRLEAITGFDAFASGEAEHLAGLSVRNKGEVHIALDSAVSVLPEILAAPEMGIVDVASLPASDAANGAQGLNELSLSGSWEPTASGGADGPLTLSRRDGAAGHLDQVVLHSFDSSDGAYDAFDAGDVDWALVPAHRYNDALDDYGDDLFAPFQAELFFGLRPSAPALAKVELRQAIAAAIDREQIVEEIYAERADPLASIVPVGVPGHQDAPCDECAHDPKRARSLVKAAYPDGKVPTIHIDFDESPSQRAMAELVAADLKDVGIPTTLRPKALAAYKTFLATGDQELFSFGWIGGYASPDAYLAPLFASASDDNLTGYHRSGVDDAIEDARGPDGSPAKRWAAAENRVLADAIVIPVAQFRTQAVASPRVQGLRHAVDGTVDWSAVSVTDAR